MGTNGTGCTEWERDFDPMTEQPHATTPLPDERKLTTLQLLKAVQFTLNVIPRRRMFVAGFKDTYQIAAEVDRHVKWAKEEQDSEYLRDLAERIFRIPAVHGVDQYDYDRLMRLARHIGPSQEDDE